MLDFDVIFNAVVENFQKIFYPEDWLATDVSFSRTELLLILLLDRRGNMMMSELSNLLNAPMSTMTGLADKLVKNGYLERGRSGNDRRVVTIELTVEGSRVAEHIKNKAMEYIQLIDEALSAEEKETVFRIYTKVKNALDLKSENLRREKNVSPMVRKIEIE